MRLLIEPLENRTLFTNLPPGFAETQVATGLTSPIAMTLAPDGRIFVTEQDGDIRVIKDGVLLSTPFVSVATDGGRSSHGALGIALDPNFSTNHYLYLNYTVITPTRFQRIVRFTADGDIATPGSMTTIFDLDTQTDYGHIGGAMHFGLDGKLYIAYGDNFQSGSGGSLSNFYTKMLRINSDGSIPTDNPFYSTATGKYRAIYAKGFRNPFQFAVQPGTGKIYIGDVGQATWEEIDEGIPGADYGWPSSEGPAVLAGQTTPVYAYNHSVSPIGQAAITAGAFYNPSVVQFPASYVGKYFFADWVNGFVKYIDPANPATASPFADGIPNLVDMTVANDGTLYYLDRANDAYGPGVAGGAVYSVKFTGLLAPSISVQPGNQTVGINLPATFSVTANGSSLTYQWQRNNVNIPGANAASYTIPSANSADNGALFRVIVTNSYGIATSNSATLTVLNNQPPVVKINTPSLNSLYTAGQSINYSGTANDPEDGALPASKYTWQVDFHHDDHVHPFITATTGATSGSFVIPNVGETDADVWYRIYLTSTDSSGLSTTVYRDVFPRKATITLTSNLPTQFKLDGQPMNTPITFVGVAGMLRSIEAPPSVGGVPFAGWSDGQSLVHTITTPSSDTTYTAIYAASTSSLTLGAFADSYVRDGSSSSTNFGSATNIDVKKDAVGFNREGYLTFDLSGSTDVVFGKVRIYGKLTSAMTGGLIAGLYAVSDTSWTESAITFANRPIAGALVDQVTITSATGQYYEFNVTSYLQQQKSLGKTKVSFDLRALNSGSAMLIFNSRNAATNPPQLAITQADSGQSLIVSPGAISVTEGSSNSFTVKLATAPAADVIVSISKNGGGDADLNASASSLTFTSSNWNTPQPVTVSATSDPDNVNGSATFTISSSGLTNQTVTATESDTTIIPPTNVTLNPIADATARAGTSANLNFGSDPLLYLKQDAANNYRESYLKFDLTSLTTITTAKLRLFGKLSDPISGGINVSIFNSTDTSWTESGVTYAAKPLVTGTSIASAIVPSTTSQWIEWDITTWLQSQKSGGKTQVALVLRANSGGALVSFNSKEAVLNRPVLVVN